MLEDYISLVYEEERKKIPYLFRLRENTESLIKFLIMGIVAVAALVCLIFCIGGSSMGKMVIRVSCTRWRIGYPQLAFIVAAVAAVLILLVLWWYKTALRLRRQADDAANAKVMVMIECDKSSGDQRAQAEEDNVKTEYKRMPGFDYEDELDLSDITIPPLTDI